MSERAGPFMFRLWDQDHTEETLCFWCTACKMDHPYRVRTPGGVRPSWEFNGNVEKPTFSPSLRVYHCTPSGGECHLNVTDGKIIYHSDSAHELAGKTMAMVPMNDDWEPA